MRTSKPRSGLVWWVLGALVAASVGALFLRAPADNPPGFYRDESGFALNAALLAETGRDEHGRLLPPYLESYGDWKSTPYAYSLAAVYAISGPSETAARTLSATFGLAAVVVIGLLGRRLSGSTVVGLVLSTLAALTPWLFEVSRLVFDVVPEPLLVASLLFVLARARDQQVWSWRTCALIGVLLATIAYTYAAGRALAPLLALALVVFARGGRLRSVLMTWAWFAAALVPLAAVIVARPGVLFERFGNVSETDDRPLVDYLASSAANVVRELNLIRWASEGDGNLRHHVGDTGSLLIGGVVLAVSGAIVLVHRRRWDSFWSYVALGCVASVVPAAISDTRIHALRSFALPVFLLALAVPALEAVADRRRTPAVALAGCAVAAAVVVQAVAFHLQYVDRGPERTTAFHAAFPGVFRSALDAARTPVAVYRSDPDAMGNAAWYAHLWDERIEILDDGESPAAGQVVVAVERDCPSCAVIASDDIFVAYEH